MLYPAPPLLRLLTHPINKGHRIFEVFLLTRLNRRKKKNKINLGFRWFCCSWACDSWSAVTFISVPFLSGSPHVFLSTFRFRLASSAPSVRRGSLPPRDPDNEGCFWGGERASAVEGMGRRRKAAWRFWNDWLQHNENTQRYKADGASLHITCPAFSLRQAYDNRAIVSHKYVLSSSSWELLHRVSVFFFSLSPRQELSLPLCDRLANLWKPSHTEIQTGIHGNYVMFTAPRVQLRLRIYSGKRHKNVTQLLPYDRLLTLVVIQSWANNELRSFGDAADSSSGHPLWSKIRRLNEDQPNFIITLTSDTVEMINQSSFHFEFKWLSPGIHWLGLSKQPRNIRRDCEQNQQWSTIFFQCWAAVVPGGQVWNHSNQLAITAHTGAVGAIISGMASVTASNKSV